MNVRVETMTSSKPYLMRAIYDWILDNQMTPHLVVDSNYPDTVVPQEFVEDGRIVLNVSPGAVRGLIIGNDQVEFSARFGGVVREILIPTEAVVGIFTRENGQGMVFPDPHYPAPGVDQPTDGDSPPTDPNPSPGTGRLPASGRGATKGKGKGGPTLKLVK
jgi:stringent starvation protein B